MSTSSLLWLLPIVFMLHDFEELIMMKPWLEKNDAALRSRLPGFTKPLFAFIGGLSHSALALIVAEEFIVLSAVTWISVEYRLYPLWFGALTGFALHLVIHIIQALIYRSYVPVIITSIPALLFSIYAAIEIQKVALMTVLTILNWSILALVLLVINYLFAAWLAHHFDRWLSQYSLD